MCHQKIMLREYCEGIRKTQGYKEGIINTKS